MKNYFKVLALLLILIVAKDTQCFATKTKKTKPTRTGSIYFSWGYNKEWYTNSTINISQPSLNNNYQMIHVSAHDHPGWDEGILNKAISIPQYNYRLGYFFGNKQDIGFEINFDHTKYLVSDPQTVRLSGTINGMTLTNASTLFSQSNGFFYYLNNGANFLLFNFVKRFELYKHNDNFRLDLLCKAGIGPVIPHVQNMFFHEANQQQFQFGGWNTGVETALRATIHKYGFIEFAQKGDYARYSNLEIYEGTAKQNFATYELILSVGFFLPTTHNRPLFAKMSDPKDISPLPAKN
jgi:hypothetical protein